MNAHARSFSKLRHTQLAICIRAAILSWWN